MAGRCAAGAARWGPWALWSLAAGLAAARLRRPGSGHSGLDLEAVLGGVGWPELAGPLAGALVAAVAGLALRRRPLASGLAAALVAAQPLLFAQSRTAPGEAVRALLVTAAWALASDGSRRRGAWLGAGAAAGLAALAGAGALPAVALILAAPVLRRGEPGARPWREVAWGVAGLLAVALLSLPFGLAAFARLHLGEVGRATGHPDLLTGLLPLLALAGAAGATWLLAARRTPGGPGSAAADAPARLALAWLLLAAGAFAVRRPPEVVAWSGLVVPLAALSAAAVAGAVEVVALGGGALRPGRVRSALAALLLAGGPALAVRHAAEVAWPGAFGLDAGRLLPAATAASAVVLFAAVLVTGLHRRLARSALVLLLLAVASVLLGGAVIVGSP